MRGKGQILCWQIAVDGVDRATFGEDGVHLLYFSAFLFPYLLFSVSFLFSYFFIIFPSNFFFLPFVTQATQNRKTAARSRAVDVINRIVRGYNNTNILTTDLREGFRVSSARCGPKRK